MNHIEFENWITHKNKRYFELKNQYLLDLKKGDDDFLRVTTDSMIREKVQLAESYENLSKITLTAENFNDVMRSQLKITELIGKYSVLMKNKGKAES